MLRIGEFNTLNILSKEAHGYHLDGGDDGIVFLPHRTLKEPVPNNSLSVDVFVYRDNKQRLIATKETPLAQVGQVSYLQVIDSNKIGAFLNWGLPKDLLAPFHEQLEPMVKDRRYLVMVFLDGQKRIAASAKLDEFLHDENQGVFKAGEAVDIVVGNKTDLGIKCIVNHSHWGVLYDNELFQHLKKGQRVSAFIKKIRDDDRIDLSLHKPGYDKNRLDDLSATILQKIERQGGFLAMNDKSPPAEIAEAFSVSKKQFKQALGKLYKQRQIVFKEDGIAKTGQD